MDRRTLMMNWDGLAESNEDDLFFDSYARISSAYPLDLQALRSGSDDDSPDNNRLSFASCISSASAFVPIAAAAAGAVGRNNNNNNNNLDQSSAPRISLSVLQDYGIWTAEPPTDITERRRRLLQGMGLMSRKMVSNINIICDTGIRKSTTTTTSNSDVNNNELVAAAAVSPSSARIFMVRSRSEGDIEFSSVDAKKRKEELIGPVSKQRLTRTSSVLMATSSSLSHHHYTNSVRRILSKENIKASCSVQYKGSFFLIKDLDSGKEFVVKESDENGSWNKLSDIETGKQLTMEEFEKYVGFSPIVNDLMRRENITPINLRHCRTKQRRHQQQKQIPPTNSYISKSFRYSKKRGVALLKNIKGVANTMGGLINVDGKERDHHHHHQSSFSNSQHWVKVRQHGKSQKDLTALYSCQQIQAHQGSIWTIKFSSDARYLASGGEDKVIRVWEVQECEILSPDQSVGRYSHRTDDEHQQPVTEICPMPYSENKRKLWRSFSNKKKRYSHSMPDYVNLPETVFALSERPIHTLEGHLEDVLDISWSRKHLLLSSSMDKTVRLWDLKTESCLKLFPHNDYVTCIQFNPALDDYFISGSLDSKVRIWNVTRGKVVAWIDLHEMVTAASYTPDGKSAIIGTRKGNCRTYKVNDCRFELKDVIELTKKKKSHVGKITGIQCSPCYPDEVLITSADSRIRIFDGSENTHKFKGLKNSESQITASYTPGGKYIISASEDNHVLIWEREEQKVSGGIGIGIIGGSISGRGKTRVVSNAYEQFHCSDVSVAIPWPGTNNINHEPPLVELRSKRHSKRGSSPRSCSGYGGGGGGGFRSGFVYDSHSNSNNRQYLQPPLPHTKKSLERLLSFPDPGLPQSSSGLDAGINGGGDSPISIAYDESPSISGSNNSNLIIDNDGARSSSSSSSSIMSSSSFSLLDGQGGGQIVPANAWGLVIVAGTLGGEIRVYQNFGLPFKVCRGPLPS